MVNVTFKDLFHEKTKFFLVLTGLTMSILMVNFGIGMINCAIEENNRFAIENPQFDAYIMQKNRNGIFEGGIVSDELYIEINNIHEVKNVEKLVIERIGFKVNTEIVGVCLIGYDISGGIEPWESNVRDRCLAENYTTIIDMSVKRFIPDINIGDKIDTGTDQKVEIVGFCENAKLWGNPIAWVSINTAKLLTHTENQNASTILAIDLEDGYNSKDLESDLNSEEINIINDQELIEYQQNQVMSNMGSSIIMMVIIGYMVTMIIIATSMFSTVIEKTPQLVTFKAQGASQRFINSIFLGQVLIFITLSTLFGTIGAILLQPLINNISVYGLSVSIPWAFITYGLSLMLGMLSAVFSMRKVKKTDPAIIFRA